MGYVEETADFDAAIMEAGDRFVTQVQPVIHPQSLAVILLDPEGDTGRVAFTWGHPHRFGSSQSASLAHAPSSIDVSEHSLRISLEGREGTLGAVLFRGDYPYGYNHEQPLLQSITQQLALTLENIQLKERLRRKLAEDEVYGNIASLVMENLPPVATYRRFAAEVKRLVGFERITFFLTDQQSGELNSVFQVGVGDSGGGSSVISDASRVTLKLGIPFSEGMVVQDNAQCGSAEPAHLGDTEGMRAALVAPINHAGEVAGAVALESRWPNAYGQTQLVLISKAAAYLGPWAANFRLSERLQGKANELAVMTGVGRAARSDDELGMVFGCVAGALNDLIPFERATVTWIEPNGSDISALHWPGGGAGAGYPNNVDGCRLETRLVFGKQEIGSLALTRGEGLEFTSEDCNTLERLALQIAPIVQSNRLKSQESRQAHQIQRLIRDSQGVYSASLSGTEIPLDAVQALRSPLTAIKGYSSALLQSDVTWPPEMSREFLESIIRETDRLNQAVSDMFPVGQNQTDVDGLNLQSTSIEALFDKVQSDLGLVDWPKPVEFCCESGLPPALVDQSRMVPAVCHLIRCASEFTLSEAGIQVEACWREGLPAIVIRDGTKSQPQGAERKEHQHPPVHPSLQPPLVNDLQVVVAGNLLHAQGVRLRTAPLASENEMFWFPVPV